MKSHKPDSNSTDWLSSRPVTWRLAGFVCVIIFCVQAGFALLSLGARTVLKLVSSDLPDSAWIIAQGLSFQLSAMLAVMIMLRSSRLSWRTVFGVRSKDIARQVGMGFIFYLALFPVFVGASIASHLMLLLFGFEVSIQDVVAIFQSIESPYLFILYLILATIVAPIVEEFLFRGILLPLIGSTWGTGSAVLATSLFFALVHFHLPAFLPLFVLAIGLSIAYIHTRNIAVPIFMHMIFNAVNIGLLFVFTK